MQNERLSVFVTAVVDPPWPYQPRGGKHIHGSGYVEYDTLTIKDLCDLPIGEHVGGYLFLWTTAPMILEAPKLIEAWGFQYATMLTWVKRTTGGGLAYGAGYWYRGCAEFVMVAKKPAMSSVRTHKRNAFEAQIRGASEKPEVFQDHVERHYPGPYLELFARRQRLGWTCLGNECPGDGKDIRESLLTVESPSSTVFPRFKKSTASWQLTKEV
jgi:site-specific DNA-methyltransferase (adenine-specific)